MSYVKYLKHAPNPFANGINPTDWWWTFLERMLFQENAPLNEKIDGLILFSTQQTWFSWITSIPCYCWNQRRARSSIICAQDSLRGAHCEKTLDKVCLLPRYMARTSGALQHWCKNVRKRGKLSLVFKFKWAQTHKAPLGLQRTSELHCGLTVLHTTPDRFSWPWCGSEGKMLCFPGWIESFRYGSGLKNIPFFNPTAWRSGNGAKMQKKLSPNCFNVLTCCCSS